MHAPDGILMAALAGEMRVLVAGASGFVGRRLLAEAQRRGYSAAGTRASRPLPGLLPYDLRTDRILDVLPPSFRLGGGQGWACLCAGIAAVEACVRDPRGSRLVNVNHTLRMIDDLAEHGFRIVYFSTSAVFDGRQSLYDESALPAPLHEYGRQKAEVEHYVLSRIPGSLVVRLSKVLSAQAAERHLLSQWAAQVRQGRAIECVCGESFSPTAADDVAAAVLRLLESGASGLFHVANAESFRRDDLARQFLRIWGREAAIVNYPPEHFGFTEPRPLCSCLDNHKLIAATGVRFRPVADIMESFFRSLQAFPAAALPREGL